MAICFMNGDYDKRYRCEYEVKDDIVEVFVEYDIEEEIESINGVRIHSFSTSYDKRDILIFDDDSKTNFLLKNASLNNYSNNYNQLYNKTISVFQSSIYFSHGDLEKLKELKNTPKASELVIYSDTINCFIGHPSIRILENDEVRTIELKNKNDEDELELNCNNIKKISISDIWSQLHKHKENNINIDYSGYIKIEFRTRVNFDELSKYIYELMIYMQLYFPNKFIINKMVVKVDNVNYGFFVSSRTIDYNIGNVERTVNDSALDFLNKCYNLIPYRNSRSKIRNIPYVVMNTSRNLEDNFLIFYRFIETYYKRENINNFISFSLKEHYKKSKEWTNEQIEKYTHEIISLRNHYVHSGYFIKNSSLKIAFPEEEKGKKNPKNYTENNANGEWILERTNTLYKVVIDIIFRKMLKYEKYKYDKIF